MSRPKPSAARAAIECEGKKPFASRALAMEVAVRCRRGSIKTRTAYRCSVCRAYHLGGVFGARHYRTVNQRHRITIDTESS